MLIKTMKLRLDELFLYAAVDLVGFLFGILVLVLMTTLKAASRIIPCSVWERLCHVFSFVLYPS